MPLIYSGCCSACGNAIKHTSNGYLAVYLDAPQVNVDTPNTMHPDDPHLIKLPHPCESLIIQGYGLTLGQAAWQGRLVHVQKVYCRDCGHNFEIRGIGAGLFDFGCTGCLFSMALAALIGYGVSHMFEHELLGGIACIVLLFCLMTVFDWSVRRLFLWKYAERAARVATPTECPNCHGRNYASPGQLKKPIPCPRCRQRSMSFKVSGKS